MDTNKQVVWCLLEELGPPDAEKIMKEVLLGALPEIRKFDELFLPDNRRQEDVTFKVSA